MSSPLRYNISDVRLTYDGPCEPYEMEKDIVADFNSRHHSVLDLYKIELEKGTIYTLDDSVNGRSNLGVFRSKQLREAVILAAALPAAAVVIDGYDSLRKLPKSEHTPETINKLKRYNDRRAAQIMSEVLQATTESVELGDEVVIESIITEGLRLKPGVETGGNPTIPVGALFGKKEHVKYYGRELRSEITKLSMGSDVIEGTTKSVKGLHSSFTSLFVTESYFKRHIPDIYVERWMAGSMFPEFNLRNVDIQEGARCIAELCGIKDFSEMSAFFLNRPRHEKAMNSLNAMGIATPFDNDGDLFPAVVMGMDGLHFPDGRGLDCMVGEIGGSAEWVVGALPLIWRGGQSLGALSSQSSLSRKDLSPEELWKERFHYTEEELILFQDARFEQKPFFVLEDIMDNPFAGGVSAFCSISDNYYLPQLKGIVIDEGSGLITTNTLMVNSLGNVKHWQLTFKCVEGFEVTVEKMKSPKHKLCGQNRSVIEKEIAKMAGNLVDRFKLRQFFVNEYYPAIVHTTGKLALLNQTIDAMIERKTLNENDRMIVDSVLKILPEWFVSMT